MKIALGRINCLSFILLGRIILFCSVFFVIVFHENIPQILTFAALFITACLLISSKFSYIIFHKKEFVVEKIIEALNLLKLEINQGKNKIFIRKTNTIVNIIKFGMTTYLSFKTSNNSPSELYVINTLIKFQARS